MTTPRTFTIGIYEKNGQMFVANNQQELEQKYPEFCKYFRIVNVEERKTKNPKRPKASKVQKAVRKRA